MKMFWFAVACGLMVGQSMADTFTYEFEDYIAAAADVGAVCSSDGKQIVACLCGEDQTPRPAAGNAEDMCSRYGEISGTGCKFQGSGNNNASYYCIMPYGDACDLCGCRSISGDATWKSVGSNRVARTIQNATSSGYECTVNASTEYGCAAGYYQSGGSGAAMTCARCPSFDGVYGTNGVGDTAKTSCYIPTSASFSDTYGKYAFVEECYYKN